MFANESNIKYNSIMLVQGDIDNVKKSVVVIGKSGRGLDTTSLRLFSTSQLSGFIIAMLICFFNRFRALNQDFMWWHVSGFDLI